MIEIQGRRIVLKAGQWSRWTQLDFELSMPAPFLPEQARQRHLPVLPPGSRAELPALRHADQHRPGRPRAEDLRAADRSSRTSSAKLGPFYTTGLPGRPQGPHQRRLRRRRISPGRRAWSWRSGSPCSSTPSTTTTTACCSSTSPAATSSRTCSGGTRTRSTRSAPTPRRRSTSATSSGSTRSSTR